jgi:hypothetical protein
LKKPLPLCALLAAMGVLAGLLPAVSGTAEAAPRTSKRSTAPVLRTGVVLFIDNHRVARTVNLRRVYRTGTKVQVPGLARGRVALQPVTSYHGHDDTADGDRDVDSTGLLSVTSVIADRVGGRTLYRMYLRSGQHTGYRYSRDGIHWKVHSPDSVIIANHVTDATVVKDRDSGRYVMTGWSKRAGQYVQLHSRDGVHFRRTPFTGSLRRLYGDVINASDDPWSRHVYAMAKQKSASGKRCSRKPVTYTGGRTFGTHVTYDNRRWKGPYNVITSDCVDVRSVAPVAGTVRPAQLYGIPFQRYGDQFVGFPWFFEVTRPAPSAHESGRVDGPVDSQIASTPDLRHKKWRRSDPVVKKGRRWARPDLIRRGRDGAWDDGMIYAQTDIVNRGGRSYVYYTGWNEEHLPVAGRQARPGAAWFPRDRFVGLKAGSKRKLAALHTRPFRLPAAAAKRQLRVNAQLQAGGWLKVGVVDARTGKAIRGYTTRQSTVVRGNRISTTVTWGGKRLGKLRNRPIRLVFHYKRGTLYSYRVS